MSPDGQKNFLRNYKNLLEKSKIWKREKSWKWAPGHQLFSTFLFALSTIARVKLFCLFLKPLSLIHNPVGRPRTQWTHTHPITTVLFMGCVCEEHTMNRTLMPYAVRQINLMPTTHTMNTYVLHHTYYNTYYNSFLHGMCMYSMHVLILKNILWMNRILMPYAVRQINLMPTTHTMTHTHRITIHFFMGCVCVYVLIVCVVGRMGHEWAFTLHLQHENILPKLSV
jgi:hypothetical protein